MLVRREQLYPFILLMILWAAVDGACPRKCRCDGLHQVVDCTQAGLTHIPWNLPDPVGLKQLILRGNHITRIISEIVTYSHLELLDLSDNELLSIDDNVFDVLHELRYLYLHNNRLISLNSSTFKGLVSLVELDLSHNQIVQLNNNIFTDLSKLAVLNLMGNEIQTLSDNAFSGLVSLKILNLSDNRFSSVPLPSITRTPSLTDLNMDFNNIETLHLFQLITSAKMLNSFSVEGNKVTSLTWMFERREDTNPPSLRKLSLKSNKLATMPIESLKHLKNLVSLDLSGNLFTEFSADSVKGLDDLKDLYLNSLAKLEVVNDFAFAEINTLTTLEMHSNRKLNTIKEKAFLGLPMLKYVDLHANDLHTLEPNTFDWLNLHSLDLRYNEWTCDCDLKWLHDLLLDADVNSTRFHTRDLYCSSPKEVASLRIKDVEEAMFRCNNSDGAHKFEDRIMIGIFVSFTIILIIVLLILLYRYNHFQCLRNRIRMRQVPLVNYHANLHPVMNGHCRVIPCHNQNEEHMQIAANEIHADDDRDEES